MQVFLEKKNLEGGVPKWTHRKLSQRTSTQIIEKKTTEETQAKIHEKASGTPAGTFGSIFAVTSGRISVRTLGDIHVLIM